MTASSLTIWTIIVLLGTGTFLLRFSFLGLIGDRKLPPWALRHLRYTPVAFIPAIAAPLVIWPDATGGEPEPTRILAALATVAVGYVTKNVLLAITAGLVTLYGTGFLLG